MPRVFHDQQTITSYILALTTQKGNYKNYQEPKKSYTFLGRTTPIGGSGICLWARGLRYVIFLQMKC